MTPDQRLKLARVLLNEAVTCAERNDIEDARHLSRLSIMHEFKKEFNQIIAGDFEMFTMVFRNQDSKNPKIRFCSRVLLDCLMQNEDFKKTFREKFILLFKNYWGLQ